LAFSIIDFLISSTVSKFRENPPHGIENQAGALFPNFFFAVKEVNLVPIETD